MKQRIIYMDILTFLSALFVVYLHSTLTVFHFRVDDNWLVSLFIQSFFRWPVPIFFMLCGANLLSYRKKYTTKLFFTKRAKRVLLPFLVWSIVWLIYDYYKGWVPNPSIKLVAKLFIYNNIQDIFWFFYAIIGIYLCMPILSLIANSANKKSVEYFIALCLMQTGVIPLFCGIFKLTIPWYTSLPIVGEYLVYILTGWYLVTFSLTKKFRVIIYILGAFSGLILFIGTYYLSLMDNNINLLLFDYNSLCTYFTAISVFVLIQSFDWNRLLSIRLKKIIMLLSSTSLGVYIIHRFFIIELNQFFKIDDASILSMTIYPIIVYLISVSLIYCLKKIPLIKQIMP